MNDKLFNLIKEGVCQYNFKPLSCKLEDIHSLCISCNKLIEENNSNLEVWKNLFLIYLKIDNNETLINIASYVLNRIFKKKFLLVIK